ncbi:MAG: hypothetical protein WCN92_04715, partial [Eubacteriales bacterium]
ASNSPNVPLRWLASLRKQKKPRCRGNPSTWKNGRAPTIPSRLSMAGARWHRQMPLMKNGSSHIRCPASAPATGLASFQSTRKKFSWMPASHSTWKSVEDVPFHAHAHFCAYTSHGAAMLRQGRLGQMLLFAHSPQAI